MKFKTIKNNVELKKELENISSIWKKNESKILDKIEEITKLTINPNKITCKIYDSTSNSYYGDKHIVLGVKGGIKKDDVLMVISHELFHIFYWKKLEEMKITKSIPGKESKKEWEIAEVAAYLLTKEPSLNRYWPKAKVYLYPEIKRTYLKVRGFWKFGDLEYFLRKAYEHNIR